ncbi:unnamed protein product [Didymodactylos carnosus]|uniref:Osteopetrosis associated transmembrane protein n=1 Tax=Didymodactylos carnosus TaxID=1234261 RepID=A0A813SWE7_9BILA|nr:unnamed protein product [Didymodactylos carnosus]CAF0801718.1 unnamed protein product [Didymodactylos carnosus]CAF3502528.1 unnamed protein product [Didymodactylos carnosus]CAF3586777.1 unnamed protein product [Didymodactylos carnosus]
MYFLLLTLLFAKVICQQNVTDAIYPIQNPCLALLDRLSDLSSQFLECSVLRSRPFKICEGCIDYFVRFKDLTSLLDKSYSDPDRLITCQGFLENYDSIQIVAQLIAFVENVWASSFCENCIKYYADVNGTVKFEFANNTLKFFRKKASLDSCVFNVTGMNYTRLMWSKQFGCKRHDPDYMAVIGISFLIPTISIIFYVSAMFKGERRLKKLSRQKRLTKSTAAAMIGVMNWMWSNPDG